MRLITLRTADRAARRWAIALAFAVMPVASSAETRQFPNPATLVGMSPSRYVNERKVALDLADSKQWIKVQPILRRLVEAYPYDGETWRALGQTRFALGSFSEAATAFVQANEVGLRNYAHDNAADAARAFARTENEAQTVHWLLVALFDKRFREPQALLAEPAFDRFRQAPAFRGLLARLTGKPGGKSMSLSDDVDIYVHLIHLFRTDFAPDQLVEVDAAAANLKRRLSRLPADEVVVEFQRLAAIAPGGHNVSASLLEGKGVGGHPIRSLPIDLYLFPEGLFVVGADADHSDLIGSRVIAFGGVPTEEMQRRVTSLIDRDQGAEGRPVALEAFFLTIIPVLRNLGAMTLADDATLTLQNARGKRSVTLAAGPFRERIQLFKDAVLGTTLPVAFRHANQSFWMEEISPSILYLQFNGVEANTDGESLSSFASRVHAQLTNVKVRTVIVDARFNLGGDTFTYGGLLQDLIGFGLDSDHHIFYIQGRDTFSAAMNFTNDVTRLTPAIVAGEPASSPRAAGDPIFFTLPYSRLRVRISTNTWSLFSPDDSRGWIAPQLPISLSSADFFSGRDTVLDRILSAAIR